MSVGAHPDDIEIGCGGTLLQFSGRESVTFTTVVMTGSPARAEEARGAAERFTPGASVFQFALRDGHLPAHWGEVKEALEGVASRVPAADVVLAPRVDDAHQDHRLLGRLVRTVWRDALTLHYEIPKWDGDMSAPTFFVPLSSDQARSKVEAIDAAFASQRSRDWWDEEMFLGLMRLRGMECRARYAEAFWVPKAVLAL
ncbi:PIG-L family deacetylase [Terrabacter sp. LjRoot27]|uniref:PIG-L deacetylase family protein n=1 Tax=Terrabacter sp. LjRoot27 TaxID=3342306 RepID=UPI003ED15F83